MEHYINKNKVENILRNLWKEDDGHNPEHRICYNKALQEVQCEIDSIEVKEINIDELLSDLDKDIKEFITTEEFERDSAVYGHFWVIAKHAFLFGLRIKLCLENLEAI